MDEVIKALKKAGFRGDIEDDARTRDEYSHDASLFEIRPELVTAPTSSADLQKLVKTVKELKKDHPHLSLTARSAGTDMSGGAINDSIIVDFKRHFTKIRSLTKEHTRVEPGVFFRHLENVAKDIHVMLPSYPASKDLCTLGGMVSNNSGGEKSLEYGKTDKFVKSLNMVLSDGNEYTFTPLTKSELDKKMKQKDFEGEIYSKMFKLLDKNYDEIQAARPTVSKDSTGYHLWNVWNRETGIFDMTKLFVGAQGTLGLTTEATFNLVPLPRHSGTLVIFLKDIKKLGHIINDVLEHRPATFEGFDNYTLELSIKLFFSFHKLIGWKQTFKLALQLVPSALLLFRGIPKMVLLVEFTGQTKEEVATKIHNLRTDLKDYKQDMLFEEDETEAKARKFWIMRRSSFQLLRTKVKEKHTAPFIDDLVVNPEYLPHFLPRLRKIIKKYKLMATISGHMGDGNFHVIPLMKMEEKKERAKLRPAMKEVNDLVLEYKGSLSGEHNDGLVRGPWLHKMYNHNINMIFKATKMILDPDNIFNPHKKTDATWEYSFSHVRDHF